MKLKIALFALLTGFIGALACGTTAHAQDKIYKMDGTEIDAKVTSIAGREVYYKRFDNPDGPGYSILKRDVAIIIYPNGKTDVFRNPNKNHDRVDASDTKTTKVTTIAAVTSDTPAYAYGKNIFSLIPAAYTKTIDGTINDVGMGLSYERLLNKKGTISINIPVMFFVSSPKDYNNSEVTNTGGSYYGVTINGGNYKSFYFMPGVKVYTGPATRKVRFSFGASLFCILGNEPSTVYTNQSYNFYNGSSATYNYAMYGFMATSAINIMVAKHLQLAFDLSAGMPGYDNRYLNEYGSPAPVLSPFMQAGLRVSYRY